VRSRDRTDVNRVYFRDLWGTGKLAQLRRESVDGVAEDAYQPLQPSAELGCPLVPRTLRSDYLDWPRLPEVFPQSFPGVQSKRDELVVDIDREQLVERMRRYCDPSVSHEQMRRICERAIVSTNKDFDPIATREILQRTGYDARNVVRYCYRPFDLRWIYYEQNTNLLQRRSPDYFPHINPENLWIEARRHHSHEYYDRGYSVRVLADNFGNGFSNFFPLYLYDEDPGQLFQARHENLSPLARRYLTQAGGDAPALFHHTLAILHAPAYRLENSGGLRQDWPRLPLPATADALAASAALGRTVAALLDPEQPVAGVTRGEPRADLRDVAVFDFAGAQPDLAVSAGWGYGGREGVVMPGRGRTVERLTAAGEPVVDVYLNGSACWRGVPAAVWAYTLGGYPVLKKWLSYREAALLGRPLRVDEVEAFCHIARRIAALLALGEALDANYRQAASLHAGGG
jgi:hypothetical protein